MEKIGLLKSDNLGAYELEEGYASYRTIIERFIGDIVLCSKKAKIHQEWDYLESIAYEELLEESENQKQCTEIINDIVVFLEKQWKKKGIN